MMKAFSLFFFLSPAKNQPSILHVSKTEYKNDDVCNHVPLQFFYPSFWGRFAACRKSIKTDTFILTMTTQSVDDPNYKLNSEHFV